MKRALIAFGLACVFGIGALIGSATADSAEPARIAPGKAVYELWRSADVHVPLSIVVRHRCLSGLFYAHRLIVVDRTPSRAVLSCRDHR